MATATPSIACIGIIGRHNNPLHISLFPPTPAQPASSFPSSVRDPLAFSFLLTTSLDIFEARLPQKLADQDFGLLQAIDDRLAMYGYLTNTGVKFVVIVDMEGRRPLPAGSGDPPNARAAAASVTGLRDADVKPVFRALQTAYINLLRNPFYDPDEHTPAAATGGGEQRAGSTQITSRWFVAEVKRIGEAWAPGVASI